MEQAAEACEVRFQSTPPVRGATAGGYSSRRLRQFQSTPPVRGATGYADYN